MSEPRRHTADSITDDVLDRLYARAEQAEAERDQLRAGLDHQAQELATWRATVATLDSGAPGTPRHRAERAEAEAARWRSGHETAEAQLHHGRRQLDELEAAITRTRALADRLTEMADSSVSADDRQLYLALAADLRNALDSQEPRP
ncbi:hypothetical protein [Streptomyces sp. NPDC101206]|uniref:hypothetical protein n=1 Tax=Streptomyces sp. NPDC101206 TaxID=3366128 RepID=UPI00380BE7ED